MTPLILTNLTEPTAVERVQAGADWLDTYRNGWLFLVDRDLISVRDGDWCPFGQVFGSYGEGLQVVREIGDPIDDEWSWAAAHGFQARPVLDACGYSVVNHADYAELDEAWYELLVARLTAGV